MMRLCAFLWAFLVSALTFGQHVHEAGEQCATMEMDQKLRQRFPQLGSLDDFENHLQTKISERKLQLATGRVTEDVIVIPVVVHIVHNGEETGNGTNISEAQVASQIATLNEDFRRAVGTPGYNTHSRGADVQIEFQLALLDPQGQVMTERGINRVYGGRSAWTRDQIENFKTTSIWDPTLYYNIWVANIAAEGNMQLLGYAQFPTNSGLAGLTDSGPANTDGVVVHVRAFGNTLKGTFPNLIAPNNQGRTLTHETGHWLGLRHIWGDQNCGNDYCEDTPTQASASSGCQTGRQSCGTVNMVENYMDYSGDACMNIFTMDQKLRMRTVLVNSPRRRELLRSNVLGNTINIAPVARFTADRRQVLMETEVQFTDRSLNGPTSWEWVFEGGEPLRSTERNPKVLYKLPGIYSVELTAKNAYGNNTERISGFIEVLNAGPCAEVTNFRGTPTLLREAEGGYVAGQNGKMSQAVSEYFENALGYTSLSGANLKFGKAFAKDGPNTEAIVNIVVWNARGFQGGPGSALEYKKVPLRQIVEDVRLNRETKVTFDREVLLSGRAFHIGFEIEYEGDTLALVTNANGESRTSTAWRQQSNGDWDLYLREIGQSVSHQVTAIYGMKPSVQIAASSVFINPGASVTLQASGAGLYNWSSTTNLPSSIGPSLLVSPSQTQTYYVVGTGSDVCQDSAAVTIYVRNVLITGTEPLDETMVTVSPNPTEEVIFIRLETLQEGKGTVSIRNLKGELVKKEDFVKGNQPLHLQHSIATYSPGVYLIEVQLGELRQIKRIVKY